MQEVCQPARRVASICDERPLNADGALQIGDTSAAQWIRTQLITPQRKLHMHPLLEDAARRASAYLDSLPTRGVAPLPTAVAKLKALDLPLPETPQSAHAVLAQLDEFGSAATARADPWCGRF